MKPIFQFALTDKLIETCRLKDRDPGEWLPVKANDSDTGWDVRAAESIFTTNGIYAKIPLGFRIFSPPGWWLKLVPRSSTFIKKYIHALYGTIDESFEGEAAFCCQFISPTIWRPGDGIQIVFGDRIGQLIPVRREEMIIKNISNEEFDKLCTERNAGRGAGGFGSTG